MVILGPGSVGEGVSLTPPAMTMLKTEDLLAATGPGAFDAFSYHFYGGDFKTVRGYEPDGNNKCRRCAFGRMACPHGSG